MTTTLTEAASRAADWLVGSGVQLRGGDDRHRGGFACWYDADTQSMPYVYAEITGYLVTLLCELAGRRRAPALLASARAAGDWLVRTADPDTGAFPCLWPLEASRFADKHDLIYTFDTGVIVNGLVHLHRATGEHRYLTAARRAADWLLRDMRRADGSFAPVYDRRTGTRPTSDAEWSLCPGAYHTKVAIGLLNLARSTDDGALRAAAAGVCDHALGFQQPDGRFVTFPAEGGTNCHPHAYAAEGLWVAGRELGRDDYLHASARATAWLLAQQRADGMIPRHWHGGTPLYQERVDVLCQTLRLAAIHLAEGRLDDTPARRQALDRLVGLVLDSQQSSDDPRVDGGLSFGRLSDGSRVPHVNVWVSAFAVQALTMHEQVMAGADHGLAPLFLV